MMSHALAEEAHNIQQILPNRNSLPNHDCSSFLNLTNYSLSFSSTLRFLTLGTDQESAQNTFVSQSGSVFMKLAFHVKPYIAGHGNKKQRFSGCSWYSSAFHT
jgi:hypothetical protein